MKVLHIVLSLRVGGLEKVVVNLVRSYKKKIDSKIICLEEKGELAEELPDIEIKSLNKKPGIRLRLIPKIMKEIKESHIQLIHTHNPAPNFYGGLAGFCTKIPVINTKHGRDDTRNNILLNKISSFFTKKIVTVSEDAKAVCEKIEKIDPKKVHTIWNGIDINKFYPKSEKEIQFVKKKKGNDIIVGVIARLALEKDHKTLFAAIKILKEKLKPPKLLVIGDGPLKNELKNEVKKLGLLENVFFGGNQKNIPNIMKCLDIFALTSETEGIPLTLLEAQSSGLPVVVSDVGGNSEVVVNGYTGFLVEKKRPDLFANKLELLIDDPNLRKNMGLNGRKRIEKYFSLENTAERYVELYKDLIIR
jgi:glycosyltransferase involved in cell wall biosynthesis